MAGHSQWANRKHRKQKQDAKKGKIFSKMARRISVAARKGGDPDLNPELRVAIEEAKALSVPNENIERAIKKGTGELDGVSYEEFQYEGYAPGGVAVLIDVVSDNRNRTASEIRHLFSKHGGNLGESGCVAWMFARKGRMEVDSDEVEEDQLFLDAAESGAEDLVQFNGNFEVTTDPEEVFDIREALEECGYEVENAGFTYVTDNYVRVEGSEIKELVNFLDELEDHDDVQEIYSNFDISDEELAKYTE